MVDFSPERIKVSETQWNDIQNVHEGKNSQTRIWYPEKISKI